MKYFFSLICLVFILIPAKAQYEAKHAIEVGNFTNWAPEYLTVTNNWNNMCITPQLSTLKCMSVITEIDGTSTRYMTPEEFYEIIDNEKTFTLTYMTKSNGINKSYTKQFTKREGKLLITPEEPQAKPNTITILSDTDVDFFNINTFDYRLAGDDQLMDKTIMEVFAEQLRKKGLRRETENPDIYLYVTKDVNQNIESIYVPEYTTTTETGSTGVGITNFLGFKGLNVGGNTGSATTVTKDVGKVKTNVTADAYLEFSILDARKLNSKTAPVIWQLTYDEHKTSEIRLLDFVKQWIGDWALTYPFHEPVFCSFAYTWGVFCKDFLNDTAISDILPGSKADYLGCKIGDEISFVRYSDTQLNTCTFRPGESFYARKLIPTTKFMKVGKKKLTQDGLTEIVNYIYIPQE